MKTLRKRLYTKATGLMSVYVRLRDKGCVCCKKPFELNRLHAGHFLHGCLDFDFRNLNGQCSGCNTFKHGNLIEYTLYMQQKYGEGIVEELKLAKANEKKHTIQELETIIKNLEWLIERQNG